MDGSGDLKGHGGDAEVPLKLFPTKGRRLHPGLGGGVLQGRLTAEAYSGTFKGFFFICFGFFFWGGCVMELLIS